MAELADLYGEHVEVLKTRWNRALEESGFDAALVHSGSLKYIFLDDMPYPFKVNAHFKSWVPLLDTPASWIIVEKGKRPHLLYYQPVDYWHKPPQDPSGYWTSAVDITLIKEPTDARRLLPRNLGRVALIGEVDSSHEPWGLQNQNPKALLERLHFDRAWKTEYEIECMRRANVRGAKGHLAAEQAFRNGVSEYDIHLEFLRGSGQTEGELPYGNIIALNENGAILHYQHQSPHRPAERHAFLIDAGANFQGYASDITRTYSAGDGEFAELIERVEKFQLELCAMVRPGLDYRELHVETHRCVAAVLAEMKFVDLDVEAMVERRVTSTFFPHGIGHYIGLQVHDVGGFSADRDGAVIPKPDGHPFLRLTRVVEEGQVFTVEPGIYFIDSLLAELKERDDAKYVNWKKVDEFRKFGGVRIEDDVVVRSGPVENLTREAFASL